MKNIKKALAALLIASTLVSGLTGCGTVKGDPLLIRAEQTLDIGEKTITSFLNYEKTHRLILANKFGLGIKHTADRIRLIAPSLYTASKTAITAYKNEITPETSSALVKATEELNNTKLQTENLMQQVAQ